MYRAVTLAALNAGLPMNDEEAIGVIAQQIVIDVRSPSVEDGRDSDVYLDNVDVTWDIRQDAVNAHVSPVSTYWAVREAMTAQQRRIASKNKVVMVGRDIGTVVMPNADLKIFLDASVEVRAQRRFQELLDLGWKTTFDNVLESLQNRDKIDSNRKIAPLKPADDAIVIKVDCLGIQQVLGKIKVLIQDREKN